MHNNLGDVTKINGAEAPVVDTIIFGSPCQDLSVAGLRKGLQHSNLGNEETTRSGLFIEAIRIIKEMRENDRRKGRTDVAIRPRFAIFENVCGAFSSNKGEDFRIVLEEMARVSQADIVIPRPAKNKWSNAGAIIGDGFSLAWRVFNASEWNVPQRRRRICLVADFNGYTAADIVFNKAEQYGESKRADAIASVRDIGEESGCEVQPFCEGLSGHTESSREKGKETSTDASGSFGAGDTRCFKADGENGGVKSFAIVGNHETSISDMTNVVVGIDKKMCMYTREFGGKVTENPMISPTLEAAMGEGGNNQPIISYSVDMGGGKSACDIIENQSPTLCTTHYGEPAVVYDARGNGDGNVCPTMTGDHQNRITDYTGVVVSMDRASFNQGQNAKFDFAIETDGTAHTLTHGPSAVCYQDSVGSLCARDYKGAGSQYVEEGKLVCSLQHIENEVYSMGHDSRSARFVNGIADTLEANDYKQPTMVACQTAGTLTANNAGGNQRMPDKENFNCVVECRNESYSEDIDIYNMLSTGDKAMTCRAGVGPEHIPCVITKRYKYIVRRLTPLECERLQGFPDQWTNIGDYTDSNGKIKKTADSHRYKALGNSIALPSWRFVLKRLSANYERIPTMASLFDGISGFGLLWTQINGRGSVLWTSEIEDFPIAVCKKHFDDEVGDYEKFL